MKLLQQCKSKSPATRLTFILVVLRIVESVHEPGIHEDQHQENKYAALLRKPKSELKSTKIECVQHVGKEDSKSKRSDKPDRQEDREKTQVLSPVISLALLPQNVVPEIA